MSLTYSPGAPALGVRPGLEVFPPYSDSLGPEALDLAAEVGMELDEWQADGVEIMLSLRPDGLWNCPTYAEFVPRQNGKGVLGEVRVLTGLFLLNELGILWSSNRYNSSKKAFSRTLAWIEGRDWMTKRIKKINRTHGEEGIILYGPDSKRITGQQEFACVARSEQSGRGFTINTNIVDEALAYTQDQAGALLFAKSAIRNSQTIYLSSPPLKTDPEIVVFKVKRQALEAEQSGVIVGIGLRDFGVRQEMNDAAKVDRFTGKPVLDVRDRRLWARTNPGYPHRISDEAIEDELKNIGPVVFARERLGAWPPMPVEVSGDTVIPGSIWAGLLDVDSQPRAPMAFAIDVDQAGAGAAIVGYGLRADGLGHVEVIAVRPGVAWVTNAAYVLNGLHDCWWIIDAQGPAKALIPKLRLAGIKPPGQDDDPAFGDLLIMRASDVAEAWGGFRDAAKTVGGEFRHRGNAHLDAALGNAVLRNIGESEALGRRTSSGSIAALVGAAAARWAFYEWVDQVQLPEFEPGAWLL